MPVRFFNPIKNKAFDAANALKYFFKEANPVVLMGAFTISWAVPYTIYAAVHVHNLRHNRNDDCKKGQSGLLTADLEQTPKP